MKRTIYPTLLIALTASAASAQYDQDITVEGRYTPEIINHDRVGQFPEPERFPLKGIRLDYSLEGIPADFIPQAVPVPARAWNAERPPCTARGYAWLSLGSRLESNLSAGYRIIRTEESLLGVRFQHNSNSLWKPRIEGADPATRMWRYDETLGVYGHRDFNGKGRLSASADYHIGNFNYYGVSNAGFPATLPVPQAPTQTLNDFAARVGWDSPAANDAISWNAAAAVRCFGYRRHYAPLGSGTGDMRGARETHLNIKGGIAFPFASGSSAGLDLTADVVGYGGYGSYKQDAGPSAISGPDTYGTLSLSPFYRFTRNRLALRIGLNLDIAAKAGPESNRFNTLHLSPAVRLDYDAGPAALYVHALGGTSLHTLAAVHEQDYYQNPWILNTAPIYTPLDAEAGFGFGPFSGFHAGASIGWRISRGLHYDGLYIMALNNSTLPLQAGWAAQTGGRTLTYNFQSASTFNLRGFSFGVNAGYDAGKILKVEGKFNWQPQHSSQGWANGLDRPEITALLSAETNPWSSLCVRLQYELRALRRATANAHWADTSPLNSSLTVVNALPNSSVLNLGAGYGVTDAVTVWVQADNLLNRRSVSLPGLPEPGIILSAGVGVSF